MLALPLLSTGCDDTADAQSSWYDPQPLLRNLRPEERRSAAEHARPHALDALPLYELDVHLSADQRRMRAREEIWFTNTYGEALSDVVLRIYANAVGDNPRVQLRGSECVDAACQVAFDGRSAITITPAAPLQPGARLRIRLQLEAELQHIDPSRTGMMAQAMEGMGRLSGGSGRLHGEYGLLAESGGIASLGNFYAMVANRREGAWVTSDDSTMGDLGTEGLAHFKAKIRCAPGSRVAVSGTVVREETLLRGQGREPQHQVEAVSALSRNFAAIVSPQFEVQEREVGGVTVRSWHLPGDRTDGQSTLEWAAGALEIYERRFGRYPYLDLDLVEAPLVGGAGGVEFSGLVTLAKMFYGSGGGMGLGMVSTLLRASGGSTGANQGGGSMQESMLEFVVAHEVAHQWWHGLVSSDARRHPFVDESLAQFSSILYMRERYGNERAEMEARRQVASNYHMMRMQGLPDAAVDQPVASFGHEMAYAGLVYGKGAFAYEKIREAVGDRQFFRAMHRYVNQHRFAVAPPRALFDELARGRHRQRVRRIERRWLEEAHGDEDLGQADMATMVGDWMGAGSLGNLQNLVNQMQRSMGQGGIPGLGGPLPGGNGGAGNVPGGADPNQALEDAVRMLRNLR